MRFDLASQWILSCSRADIPAVPVQLPGDNYSALLDAGLIPDPCIGLNEKAVQWVHECDWTFSREFELDPAFLAARVIFLNLDSIDTFGEIRINGVLAGKSENMFTRFRADVKPLLKTGLNRIEVLLKSPSRRALEESAKQPFELVSLKFMNSVPHLNLIRKVQCHGGWDWGITLVGSGLYGDMYLEGVENARIEYVYTAQTHRQDCCMVDVTAELLAAEAGSTTLEFAFNGEVRKCETALQPGKNTVHASFEVQQPKLWNPVGYGEQNLYTLKVSTCDETVEKKIGLRTMELVTQPDEIGYSMKIRVNGTDVFCKGANWIPMDCLPRNYTRENYRKLLTAARDANMNMLREWGGGLYENEDFYELCDELGILVWQDCMFTCSQYPSTHDFLELVREELAYQVKRLRDHACIALWCGDNEVALGLRWGAPENRLRDVGNYERRSYVVETAVLENDPTRQFWMSSPCGGPLDYDYSLTHGDTHSWDIWSGCKPFSAYYDLIPRFCSEFGFQSLASMNAIRRFTEGKDLNMTSPVMEHHQRRPGADAKILTMFAHYFRLPSGFGNTVYLSQVQQALAIKTGVEFWRSCKPRCMGALYWQLNDNWPVSSWSSIDYYGNWKQLHYHAKRFFAPVISVCVPDKENRLELRVSSDVPRPLSGSLKFRIMDFSGTVRKSLEIPVELKLQESLAVQKLDRAEWAEKPDEVFAYMELNLTDGATAYSHCNDFFFTEYKHCTLREAGIRHTLEQKDGLWHLKLESDFPAFFVFAELKDLTTVFSDNSFTLLPGEPHELTFSADAGLTKEQLEQRLEIRDLYGSCLEQSN